jgi:hypothetical protein
MKKLFAIILLSILCLSLVLAINTPENSRNIWTTKNACGNVTQDVNQFALGDKVYINGKNFDPISYNWFIRGYAQGSSCDPDINVSSGSYTVDKSGQFCFEAYIVNRDDCGQYKVRLGDNVDNYNVNVPIVPEFGVIIGALTILGAVGTFFIIRRR